MSSGLAGRRDDGFLGGRLRDWGRVATAGLGIYCVSFFAWTVLGGAPGAAKAAITDVAFIPAGLLAAVLAARTSRDDHASPEACGAWRRLALAFLLYWTGDLLWWIFKVGLQSEPFSVSFSAATFFYFAHYPFFLAGLLAFPTVLRSRSRRLEFWLDAATVLLGGSMVVWHFVLGPAAAHSSSSTTASLLYLAYPVGDLVLLLAAAVTILSQTDDATRRSFLWLVGGLVVDFVADLIQGANALGPGLVSGGPADGFFMLQWFCYGMSAHVFQRRARPKRAEDLEPQLSFNLLPYAAVLVGYGVLLFAVVLNWSTTFGGLVAWAIALTGVVLARQVASERENLRLLGERAARKSEARFRTLVQNASDVIVVVDAERRIRYLTPSIERVLGHPVDGLLGRPLATLIHPADLARALGQLADAAGRPSVAGPAAWRVSHRDGAWRHVEVTALSLLADPDIEGIVLTLRDVHERKQAEAEREAAITELKLKNAELEQFTYTVSHDLKSPLVTVAGFLGHLERDAVAGDKHKVSEDAARIRQAVTKMGALLEDLLELSRIGRVTHPSQDVPFADIAKDAVELVGGRLEQRGVRVEIQEGLPTVYGDRLRLVAVVQNLVDNAAKFMRPGVDPLVEIGSRGPDATGHTILFVRDNGIGIAPEFHDRVFGLFNKLDPQTEGTGVGLAVVRRIVEAHGGRIWVESSAGQGAAFCFTLPERNGN